MKIFAQFPSFQAHVHLWFGIPFKWLSCLFQKQSSFVADVMGRIETNTDAVAAAKSTDLVVEAIVENLDIKKRLFTALDAAVPK